jgi:myo-inositol-1(or 4)-monophosphatase
MEKMLGKILDFIKIAGEVSLQNYGKTDNSHFKSDNVIDLVTQSDTAISEMFVKFITDNFSDLDYCIIDEESLDTLGEDPFTEINKHEWQFVIDPIDGTLTYALEVPMFGISVGVLHRGKPYCGAAYAPALGELIHGSEHQAFWVKNAFTNTEQKTELKPGEFGKLPLVLNIDWFARSNDNIDFKIDMPSNFYSAVVHLIYMATGRGKCFYFGVKIWDMAGSWAIMKLLGIEFIDYRTGEILEKLSADKFKNTLQIKNCHIVCKPQDFEYFKNISEEIDK